MLKKATPNLSFAILTALLTLATLAIFQSIPAHAATGKDYVIVIDISTSMQDIFQDVKKHSKKAIGNTSVGDSVTIITFGERATLVARKHIRGKADKKSLQDSIDTLYPTDFATYINRGLEKGLSELKHLFEQNPERKRVLLWLSDDKDNPPGELGDAFITLDNLKEKNASFNPGSEWFAYDAPSLDDEVENKSIEDFVHWARRTTFRVEMRSPSFDFGSFEDENVTKTIAVTFDPKNPGADGLQFLISARLTSKETGKKVPVTITPARVTSSGKLWRERFKLTFKAAPGQYTGAIMFRPIAVGVLEISPKNSSFKVAITAPKVEPEKPAIPIEAPEPRGLLADAKDQGIIATESRPPGTTRIEKPIGFGPLEPGKKDSKMVMIFLSKEADPKSITHDLSLELPEGISFETRFFGKGKELTAEMSVVVDKDIQLPSEFALDRSFEGSVRFKSSEPGVEVLPVYFPIRLSFNADRVQWGTKMLPQTGVGQVKARGMSFDELTRDMRDKRKERGLVATFFSDAYSTARETSLLWPMLAAIAIFIFLMLYRMRPASEIFTGELIAIRDPGEPSMKNIHLKRIGSLHDKNVLTLGSSVNADVRLNHDSVAPVHCKMSAKTLGGSTDISIVPIKGNPVKINEIEQTSKVSLTDKDLIGIGDFILLFSNPEAQKEVVARFLDGRTMRGNPVTWDINALTFEILRTDTVEEGGTTEEITDVSFAELKAVFLMQDASKPGSASMPADRVNRDEFFEITFTDGEKVEGFPLKDYSEAARRFYIVPFDIPNVSSILIERAGIDIIAMGKPPTESPKSRKKKKREKHEKHEKEE
jgi:hypothetical protein